VTPCKRFRYDVTSNSFLGSLPSGVSVSNIKGRLMEAETDNCGSTHYTDEWFSYTVRGETSDVYELTPHSSPTYYHVSQTYWPNGGPNVLSGNIGLPTITYGAEGEGRPSTVSASSGQNPVSAANYYNLYASPYQLSVTLGSGDSDTFTYDPNTLRLNKYQFKIGTQTVTGTLGWNANWSLGSLGITDPFSTANTQTCNYIADDLARINQASCGTIWGQNFSYDPFGNIQKTAISGTGGSTFAPTYQSSPSITNRVSSVGGVSATYDANGNSLNDTFRTSSWDADGNPVTIGSVSLTYDASDRMVEQSVSGTNSEIVYSPAGVKLALMNGTTLTKAFVPLPGGATAVYTSSGLAYYRHADHLGSSRFASTPTQTLYADLAYSPFGETYASSGAIDPSFTGENQDTTAGLYDFIYREHDPNQARWTSPDPAGLAAVDSTNPQSWNRYAYVTNNPLMLTDALGLCGGTGQYPDLPCPVGTSVTVNGDTGGVSWGDGQPSGGVFGNGGGHFAPLLDGGGGGGAPSKTGCFVKGVVAGAATALVVGAVAIVAAPVVGATAVTVGLGVLAVAGTASLGWTASHDISNHNWAGVAYDAGSLVGGLATGIAGGPRVATAIDPNATPGWSPQSWSAQAYDSSKGSLGDWMGTGPTHASAGVSTGAGGWLSSLFGAGCH
jgi:RHS repeat-associated protein